MAANSLFPGFFKFLYVSATQEHTHIVPARSPTGADDPITTDSVMQADGTVVDADVAAEDYADGIALVLSTDTTITAWELYGMDTPTSEPELIALATLDVDGLFTEGGPEDCMGTFSFRTSKNGKAKVVLMDIPISYDQVVRTFNPATTTGIDGLINYMLGDTNPRIGRDGGTFIQFRGLVTKESDALRRARIF
jgi:hypothetical protein